MNIASIIVLTLIGIVCGVIIYIAYVKIPHKVKGLEKIEEVSQSLPGMNCGACGFAGCFAYAQELVKNPDVITQSPCSVAMQNPEAVSCLEKSLNISLDAAAMCKKAVIHCGGNSEVVYEYSGAKSCKAAAQLWGGYKKCPYACLGFGDCVKACPQGGISIDKEKGIAVIDRSQCTGCGLCAAECPQNLIELVPADTKVVFQCNYEPLRDIPGRGKCDYGCTHCRKCFNACEYEAIIWNKLKAAPEFDVEKCTLCGKCIEACPQNTLTSASPAGVKCEAAPAA
ncbi:4Fe-4S binding protein [Chloroflexota bacterium]